MSCTIVNLDPKTPRRPSMKPVRLAALFLVSFVCVMPLAHPVRAHEEQKQAPMSEAKRQLILELVELVNQRVSAAEIADALVRELDVVFAKTYEDEIRASNEYTPD